MNETMTDQSRLKVGIAGIGRMGGAIATRLLKSGHQTAVWNRSAHKAEALRELGATVFETPAELIRHVDFLITILTDDAAIDSVYRSASGVLSTPLTGKVIIEMSTVRPQTEIALAAAVKAQGGGFVDCPVGGTIQPALMGNLLGFAGATESDYVRARVVLDHLCRRVEHVGPVGAGASMKLAINLPLVVYWQALGEAYVLCRHLQLDPKLMVELFAESSAGPNVLRVRAVDVANALGGMVKEDPAFDCDLLRKDLTTMINEAATRGVELPLCAQTLKIYDEASKVGWGGRDGTEMAAYWSWRTSTFPT